MALTSATSQTRVASTPKLKAETARRLKSKGRQHAAINILNVKTRQLKVKTQGRGTHEGDFRAETILSRIQEVMSSSHQENTTTSPRRGGWRREQDRRWGASPSPAHGSNRKTGSNAETREERGPDSNRQNKNQRSESGDQKLVLWGKPNIWPDVLRVLKDISGGLQDTGTLTILAGEGKPTGHLHSDRLHCPV